MIYSKRRINEIISRVLTFPSGYVYEFAGLIPVEERLPVLKHLYQGKIALQD